MTDSTPLLNDIQNDSESEEEKVLGSKSPLVTLLSLIVGPLFSQLTFSFYEIFNSYMVSKGEGGEGLEVLASIYFFDNIIYSFGIFSSISAASYLPYLLAQGKKQECNKLITDLFKVVLFLGILYPAIVIPISKPLIFWLSGKEEVAEDAFKYQCIASGFSVVMFSFQLLCGILQALGRTYLYGFMQVTALVLDMGLILPISLFVLKWNVWCVAFSQVLSQSIPTLILFGMLMCNKLTFELKPSMFFSKISQETWAALKVGLASFILNLSEAFPIFALQKYIMLVAEYCGVLDETLTSYSIISRLYAFAICILVAFDSAFLPPASYAYGKKQYKRVLKLVFHTLWMTFAWGGTLASLFIIFGKQVFGIFTDNPKVVKVACEISPFCYYTLPLYCIHALAISFLQAIKKSSTATAISIITTILPMPIISTAIYFTKGKYNLKWIFSTYIFDDISTSLIAIFFSLPAIIRLFKLKDGETFTVEKDTDNSKSIETIVSYN